MKSTFNIRDLCGPPALGGAMGFVAGWIAGALLLLAVAVWYGLSGQVLDIRPFMPRVPFAVFSVVFLVVTVTGWVVITVAAIRERRAASIGDGAVAQRTARQKSADGPQVSGGDAANG